MLWKYKYRSQGIAALWFALASCVPVSFNFLVRGSAEDIDYVLFGLLPVIFASLGGYALGWRILHHARIVKPAQAAKSGVLVTSLAYGLLALTMSTQYALQRTPSDDIVGPGPVVTFLVKLMFSSVAYLVFAPVFAMPLFLVMFATGAGAGLLLYRIRDRFKSNIRD